MFVSLRGVQNQVIHVRAPLTGVPFNPPVYPTLAKKPKDVSVKAGESFELACKARGHPDPVTRLQREGVTTFPAATTKRMHLTKDGSFLISNATAEDMGLYTCIAENMAGSVNSSAFVTVLGKFPAGTGTVTLQDTVV